MKAYRDFSCISVGQRYWIGSVPQDEGTEFLYVGGNWFLNVLVPDLSELDLKAMKAGEFQFGAYVEDDILFFLHHFGSPWRWGDAPFHFGIVPPDLQVLPPPWQDGLRVLLSVVAVDTRLNRVMALRSITVPPPVLQIVLDTIQRQVDLPFDKTSYFSRVRSIQARLTPEAMTQLGVVGRGGE